MKPKFSASAQEDIALVNRAKAGDQAAFTKLMSKYRESIFFMTLKMVHTREDAEDLTIDAIGKAFNNLANYQEDYAFSTWLFRIATNNCIDFIRKKKLQTTSIEKQVQGKDDEVVTIVVKDHTPNPEEHLVKEQRAKRIREAIASLPEKYRQLIELRFLDEKSYEEIAEECDLPLGTVKAQLFRAKDLLYNLLKESKERY